MTAKEWILRESAPAEWKAQFSDLNPVILQLLWNREVHDGAEVKQFLSPDYKRDLHDPFLFKEMEKVVARLFLAVEKGEKIFVYGDYDADGVPGATIIKSTLDALGAVTDIYIPHREKEGYGLNSAAVSYMAKQNAKVVITCDCGISNAAEVSEAQARGIDVIITDHHRIPEVVPAAFAILHPLIPGEEYPNKFLTGGGVAFKLAQGLIQKSKIQNPKSKIEDGLEKWLLDLVAISTVADVGRLVGENRTLVRYGLLVLNKTRRVGLQKLIEVAGIKPGALDTYSIGWQIAPRINAAGRMDHANAAFKLLITNDITEATELASALNTANSARQRATDLALKEARELVSAFNSQVSGGPYLLAAFKESWNPGVIGLVAGRLTEEFRRPVLIACKNEMGVIVASARSIAEFNIIEALAASKDYLAKFGGHPRAAGFSVESEEKWHSLIEHLQKLAREALQAIDIRPTMYVDADVTLPQINWDFVTQLQALEPHGEGNPRPRFLIHGLQVLGFDGVGNNGKHLRLTAADESRRPQKMIGFNCGQWCDKLSVGDLIDTVVEVGVNEWNGNRDIELKIADLRFHKP